MDVQNQGAWPSGKRAKFSHGPCDNRDAGSNFDSQIIAVAQEMLLHRLDCLAEYRGTLVSFVAVAGERRGVEPTVTIWPFCVCLPCDPA